MTTHLIPLPTEPVTSDDGFGGIHTEHRVSKPWDSGSLDRIPTKDIDQLLFDYFTSVGDEVYLSSNDMRFTMAIRVTPAGVQHYRALEVRVG